MRFCEAPEKCSMPVFSTDKLTRKGYCRMHANRYRTDLDRRSIIQKAMSKQKSLNGKIRGLSKPDEEKGNKKMMLELWYLARKYEMTGKCEECGKTTNKYDDKYYRWSVCHIVPKSLIPSAATNHNNWIELCQYHHQEYDADFDRAARLKCFTNIKLKFETFKHLIPNEELRKINPHLL